jgi:hypothetical protein
MLQFYFLSISCNLIAGSALAFEAIYRKIPRLTALGNLLSVRNGKLSIGLSVLLVGFITLFVPADGFLIIGDLIPSLAGIAMGIALLFEVFRQDAVFPSESMEKQDRPPLPYRTTMGLLGIAVAVLHFFLPDRPFL